MRNSKADLEKLGFVTQSQTEDETYGKIGTPGRDQYEKELRMEMVGEFLKKMRKNKRLTQEDLAKRMGTDKTYVSKIENNLKDSKLTTIKRYIEALNVSKFSFRFELEDGSPTELRLI